MLAICGQIFLKGILNLVRDYELKFNIIPKIFT
jgi:hypothetical protein